MTQLGFPSITVLGRGVHHCTRHIVCLWGFHRINKYQLSIYLNYKYSMLIILFYAAKHTLEDEDDMLLIDSDYRFSDEEDNNFYNLMFK